MNDARGDAIAKPRSFVERAGATLGRYELLVPIASGGMANVWAARLVGHGGFTKIVALKTMLPDLLEDPTFEAMFLDEARIAAKLRHPNVCETFDLGEDDGVLYLAMEWVDGPSLLRLTRPDGRRRQPLPHRLGAHVVSEACAGLHAAHELLDDDGTPLRVIHRDVSPHNILLSLAGAVKLTDFGVAKAQRKQHATLTGELKGKVAYMSPEQLRGDTSLDRRSDVFSLGCVLYEITTGQRPFEAENDGAIVRMILAGEVPRPRVHDPSYPPDLESIVMTALASEPAERFSTADEMRVALGVYLAKREPITTTDLAQVVGARYAAVGEARREEIRRACARRSPGGTSSRTHVRPFDGEDAASTAPPPPSASFGPPPVVFDAPPPEPLLGPGPGSFGPASRSSGPASGSFGPASGSFGPASGSFGPASRPSGPASKQPFSFKPTGFTPRIRETPPPPASSSGIPPAPPSSGGALLPSAGAVRIATPGVAFTPSDPALRTATPGKGFAPSLPTAPASLPRSSVAPPSFARIAPPPSDKAPSDKAPSSLGPTRSTPQSFGPASSRTVAATSAPRVPAPAQGGRGRLVALAAAGFAFVLLAVGGRELARRRAVPSAPAHPISTPSAIASAAASGAPAATGETPPAERPPAASPRITFRVTPRNALMLVDGVVMPAGADGIDRPSAGVRRVLFRADRFEDYVEVVDPATPAVLDIVLVPRGGAVRRPRVPRPPPSASSSAGAALPNPYE